MAPTPSKRRPEPRPWWLGLLAVLSLGWGSPLWAQDFASARRAMVAEIEAEVQATADYIDKATLDPRVMQAMGQVPRHEYVPENLRRQAYENRPLPIGHGQTISQPYIVALMSDLCRVPPGGRVLEIGTGSGYQAAILAAMGTKAYSIEIIPDLAREAGERLRRLGLHDIRLRTADGFHGWEEAAPFDAILVTAAAGQIPPPLIRQLAPGGRLVIPIGGRFQVQHLMLVEKNAAGEISTRQLLPVVFVPLTGGH